MTKTKLIDTIAGAIDTYCWAHKCTQTEVAKKLKYPNPRLADL